MTLLDVQDGIRVSSVQGGIVRGGTFTIPAFEVSVTATHGLGVTPSWAIAGSGEEYPGLPIGVSSKTSTLLVINIREPQAMDVTGYWACSLNS